MLGVHVVFTAQRGDMAVAVNRLGTSVAFDEGRTVTAAYPLSGMTTELKCRILSWIGLLLTRQVL
jgi:hypothetical protein